MSIAVVSNLPFCQDHMDQNPHNTGGECQHSRDISLETHVSTTKMPVAANSTSHQGLLVGSPALQLQTYRRCKSHFPAGLFWYELCGCVEIGLLGPAHRYYSLSRMVNEATRRRHFHCKYAKSGKCHSKPCGYVQPTLLEVQLLLISFSRHFFQCCCHPFAAA